MSEFITNPWPWYVSGVLIGATIPILLFFANKMLGISTSMQHICAAILPSKAKYFNYDWKKGTWSLVFALGLVLGGVFTSFFMENPHPVQISENTKADLSELGITNFDGLLPIEIFSEDQIFTLNGLIFMILGGFLVGFGARYAGGCTSGHGIMGLSQGSISSLVAVVSFFVGGAVVTNFIYPLIF